MCFFCVFCGKFCNILYIRMASVIRVAVKKQNFKYLTFLSRNFCQTVKHTELVVTTKQKHLHIIGINRPEKRNCVNPETATQLIEAFQRFEDDNEAYVAVLYGKGGNFCSGYDLQVVADGNIKDISLKNGSPMGPAHKLLKKPVIAAISGYAVAFGLELALFCDVRIAEDTAVMGYFNRRFGVPLIDGGTVRLPKLIGLSRALDLILTGRGINAKTALEMGIISKVVPSGTSLGTAVDYANSLCKFPQECLRADRLSAYHSAFGSESLEEALKYECENSAMENSVEGAKRFVDGIGRHGSFHLDSKLSNQTNS